LLLFNALQCTGCRATLAALSLDVAYFHVTAEVGFKRMPHEDDAAHGLYMRVNVKAEQKILERENASVAKSSTTAALRERGSFRMVN
jgi:hypothetical protein